MLMPGVSKIYIGESRSAAEPRSRFSHSSTESIPLTMCSSGILQTIERRRWTIFSPVMLGDMYMTGIRWSMAILFTIDSVSEDFPIAGRPATVIKSPS